MLRMFQAQTLGLQGLQMGATGDEGDVLAGRLEPRADVAADATTAHDHDPHRLSPSFRPSLQWAASPDPHDDAIAS
ncbi:MAG TPA: hypothetical protein PK306_05765 [Aquabacterium sp.]|nr:hypothetical protein [Aquabacterium sp.]